MTMRVIKSLFALFTFLLSFNSLALASSNTIVGLAYDYSSGMGSLYSINPGADGSYNSSQWVMQVSSASNPFVLRTGGNRFMALLHDGTLLTKDGTYGNWITQTTGVRWAEIASSGEMIIINSAGNVYTKVGTYDPWVQQTSGGGAHDIAIGGNGRLMVIDRDNNAYSKESTYDAWVLQVTGAKWIGASATGRLIVDDSSFNLYYKDYTYATWNRIAGPTTDGTLATPYIN